MAAQHLLNAREGSALVEEALDGLCEMYPDTLARLDGFSQGVKVIVRRDFEEQKAKGRVAVISGGGSGHEPAHAGLVGDGMLTAAVCGDVFASPQTKAVLAAILAVTGDAGCLVIIKNYTGDRLNFGLAVEQAKGEFGKRVEMLVVADDAALDASGHRARGIAGTAFVHKAAGAAAAAGSDLGGVVSAAQSVLDSVRTMGVALQPCTVPGKQRDAARLAHGEMEVGMGIHGEPGARKAPVASAADTCDMLLTRVCEVGKFGSGAQVALLVNSLGNLMPLELGAVTTSALQWCTAKGIKVVRYASAGIVTSLDMHGFSLTLLRATEPLLELLDAPTTAPGWAKLRQPACSSHGGRGLVPLPSGIAEEEPTRRPAELSPVGQLIEKVIRAACESVAAAEPQLTELDTKIGDGDCGITLRQGAGRMLSDMGSCWPLNDPAAVCFALQRSAASSMGGTSGVLYCIAAQAAGASLQGVKDGANPTGADFAEAFCAAVDALGRYGGAGVGSGTMMDALIPARDAFRAGKGIKEAAAAAREGADSTARLTASHGRAAYVNSDAQQGVCDPGAVACALWLEAACAAAQ
eukprot:TRINITY_DN5931_c1_g2_i1.p2 TRINITY_DN5931_c1_g2~~TRINITY_DN5931_c1_g2_i1.p2  ORF type:complete len:580 (+),score=173.31 TRINITY_DN5931_c1_g2_i1:85-1824(+)